MTENPEPDTTAGEPAEDAAVQPDALTGATPDADEIQADDPNHDPEATEYELRSGLPTSPSDQDPGSMLNR